jgi:hypothetical protein
MVGCDNRLTRMPYHCKSHSFLQTYEIRSISIFEVQNTYWLHHALHGVREFWKVRTYLHCCLHSGYRKTTVLPLGRLLWIVHGILRSLSPAQWWTISTVPPYDGLVVDKTGGNVQRTSISSSRSDSELFTAVWRRQREYGRSRSGESMAAWLVVHDVVIVLWPYSVIN